MYTVVPMVGSQLDQAIIIPGGGYATNTYNFTGVGVTGEYINISTGIGTYSKSCFYINTSGITKPEGCIVVDVDGDPYENTSAGLASSFRVALEEDTDIASLITVTNTTTTNAIITLDTMNDAYNWAVTDTVTNGSWAAASFSGGVDGSNWNSTVNTELPTAVSLWESLAGIIKIAAFLIIIGGFMQTIRGIRG